MTKIFTKLRGQEDAARHLKSGMVKRRGPHTVPPQKLLSKISKIIVFQILTVIVMGASAESKISSIMLGKSEIAGKLPVNEINFMEKEKKVRRVKMRGGKKARNYYPIKDGSGTENSISTESVENKVTTMSPATTTTPNTTFSTTTTDNYQLMTMLSTSKPSYVNIIRNTGVSTNTTQTQPLFNIEQEDSSPANRELLEDRTEFSRRLPASDNDDEDEDDEPMQSRTSSRLLFPPAIKSTASPTSYMTALTPEFNHVSWLTHPSSTSSTPATFSLGKMFGLTESEVNYQTNFKTFKSSDSSSKTKYIKNHSFFQMGKKQQLTTTKPPQKQIHITTVSSLKDPVAHFGFKKTTTPVSKKRQFVSIFFYKLCI